MSQYYQVLFDKFEASKTIHERAYVLEDIMRWLEDKIKKQINDNSPELQEQVIRTYNHHLKHFYTYSNERIIIQKTTISTGMLFFAITCRMELHMHEPSWRETDTHIRFNDIAPHWIDSDFIDDNTDPILFLDCASAMQILLKIQRNWYCKKWDPDTLFNVIKWIERRFSILITYPYDENTFTLSQYRQKHGSKFMGNMALIYDCYALITSMYLDINWCRRYSLEEQLPDLDDTKAQIFMKKIMENTQGDNLCIQYQKQYIEEKVRLADALIFARRRSEVVGPSHMEIITECNGQDRARLVHKNADVRLLEIYELPENHDNIWQVVIDYYINQKLSFSWISHFFVNRFASSLEYKPINDYSDPTVIHVPIQNCFALVYDGKCMPCSSMLQSILHWMDCVLKHRKGILKVNKRNNDLNEILDEFLVQ